MQYVVLTPNIDGLDGVSCLARLVVAAVGAERTSVISLNDRGHPPAGQADRVGCAGSRAQFIAAAIGAAAGVGRDTTIISVHLHVAPAAIAFMARGAATAVMLCGIEAWKPLTWAQTRALRSARMLLAISKFTAERFHAVQPTFRDREIVICHPGIPDGSTASARPSFDPPTVLIVGRMAADERYKGHDLLLETWPEVRRAVPNAQLRIVGDGDDRHRLQQRAARLGCNVGIEFVGRVPADRLEAEYRRCSVFVMPSTNEGFGFVFLEAMRAACPCIGVRGAADEIIVDRETGVVLPGQSPTDLVNAIVRILQRRDDAERMGLAGRERFARDFTDAAFRSRLLAALARLDNGAAA